MNLCEKIHNCHPPPTSILILKSTVTATNLTIIDTIPFDTFHMQFSAGYQPTVGVDYGFKIQHVDGIDCKYIISHA